MFPYLPPYPAAEGLAARVAFILQAAMVYVASRVRQTVPGMRGTLIPVRFERLINLWLEARKRAIVALIGRIEAGTQKPPRPYKAREVKAAEAGAVRARQAPTFVLPTTFAWLCVVGREMNAPGGWLGTLVGEADMRAMVTAHPRLARLIRPVLRMLGQQPPDWFPRTPKRERSKRPARRWRGPTGPAAADDPAREVTRFITAESAKQHAAAVAMLYAGCAGGPPPEVAKRRTRPAPSPPAPAPTEAAFAAEVPADREKYYYAETWNGKLIPVRRRWG
jgi:hypothetical protein